MRDNNEGGGEGTVITSLRTGLLGGTLTGGWVQELAAVEPAVTVVVE